MESGKKMKTGTFNQKPDLSSRWLHAEWISGDLCLARDPVKEPLRFPKSNHVLGPARILDSALAEEASDLSPIVPLRAER